MCGIGGMLGEVDSAVLQRMNSLQSHRGPDGAQIWHDESCGLSHTRLSIVDLAGSDQPIGSDHSAVLVANGEIYNYSNLRQNRNLQQYAWRTKGDSETILALHQQSSLKGNIGAGSAGRGASDSATGLSKGSRARLHAKWISQLDGMFAFALWDPIVGELILARDPFGIKPLVRTLVEDTLLFSSEVKALRAHESHIPKLDEVALVARLAYEYPIDGTTLFAGVHQVRPGTVETWSIIDGKATLTGVARFEIQEVAPLPTSAWNPDTDAKILLDSFTTSVSERLMAEVPVGIVLSGGLDSALVAAVAHEAAEIAGQPVPACWTVAESEENPDWRAAEVVASALDLEHHQYILDDSTFEDYLPKLAWHGEDLDFTVLFFQPLFAKMAESVTVGLCGQGADELHAGYPRYTDIHSHIKTIDERLSAIEHPAARALQRGDVPAGNEWWMDNISPNSLIETESIIASKGSKAIPVGGPSGSVLTDFLQFELEHGQLSNFQLRLVDRHSMAASLEVRVPFLGSAHRAEAHRLPMNWRLPAGGVDANRIDGLEKAALRRAADLTKLPSEIVRRPKLPAGTATSPTLIGELLRELSPRAEEIIARHPLMAGALNTQPDIAIGLGMFEALHIVDRGLGGKGKSVVDLLDGVI
ncbi:MAG TPA: asparagine synthase (glutamine-hydrolyzing) [Candidatus Poseidoniales archaeon]|nr:asparagine synthase (glutamine-hydrolyzing) [Candidatus Poseidoniales archaeon]